MIELSKPLIGDEERDAVARVLASGRLTSGPEVAAFEEEFAKYVGTDHAVAVGSGTAGLHLGLLALGIGPGDEVIVPSFTFAATANAVRMCGGTPVFADVDADTFCIDPDRVKAAITPNTVAVMPVHLFGHPAAMDEITEIAEGHGISIVEDAAQAHGAALGGKRAGSLGAFGVFSFYPTKNMTTGEGGMVTTSDDALADTVRLLRNQGMRARYEHEVVGLNERMTEIEGAIGRVQLRHLDAWNRQRTLNAERYRENLSAAYITPRAADEVTHAYHQFTVRSRHRSRSIAALEEAGIGYGIYYPLPVHMQPPYASSSVTLPLTERLAGEVLSLPIGPHCDIADVDVVSKVLNEAAESG